MLSWIKKTIDKNLAVIFWVCVAILLVLLVLNMLSQTKGTYTNYSNMIRDLLLKPYNTNNFSSNNNVFRSPSAEVGVGYTSKGEAECKRAIELITGKTFFKTRPPFLKNEITGHILELDCYNPELRLAVEYNGIQHYQYTPIFHKTKDAFFNTKYRDKIKKELCDKEGVLLLVVPHTVSLENIKPFLEEKLRVLNINKSSS